MRSYSIIPNRNVIIQNLLFLYKAIQASESEDGRKIIANALFLLHQEKNDEETVWGAQEKHVKLIQKYMDDNYFKNITVSDIADRFYLSKNYIRNLFVKYLGISPKQYIQENRMNRARELLLETDISISLIALSVGYRDALLFSKMFSKHFSISPKKYRMQNRQTV